MIVNNCFLGLYKHERVMQPTSFQVVFFLLIMLCVICKLVPMPNMVFSNREQPVLSFAGGNEVTYGFYRRAHTWFDL